MRKITKKEEDVLDAIKNIIKQIKETNGTPTFPSFPSFNITFEDYPRSSTEPAERDEQGTFYGYKQLMLKGQRLFSPTYPAEWRDGRLTADEEPSLHNRNGIYFTKSKTHDELRKIQAFYDANVLVKCACFGTVLETSSGFRCSQAIITEVYQDGNWITYQDFQERTRTYPDWNKEAEWGESPIYSYRKAYYATWNPLPNVADESSTEGGE